MDDLKITIDTFSPDDVRDFGYFIQRQKKKKGRKDYELFKLLLLKKPLKSQELVERLYPEDSNTVAYYALRKRLMQQLTDFIVLKQMAEDPTAGSTVMGLLSLARYLFDSQAERLAWNILRKAEKIASQNEQFGLLNTVYNLQIEKADSLHADELEDIIQKRNANKLISEEDERANIASSLIAKRLGHARHQGRYLKFEDTIQEVLDTYGLTQAVSQRPSLLYKLMQIARSAVLIRKDFYTFEPYIIHQYQTAMHTHGFSKAHQYYRMSLLYMIAHVLYRNRKFTQSNQYLAELNEALQKEAATQFTTFFPKYVLLKAANDAFLRQLPEAVQAMEHLLSHKKITLQPKDYLAAKLGLSFLYFAQGAFQKANHVLLYLDKTDKWCEKIMGLEWVLKKKMGEVIIQYEFGNLDLALDQIQAFERKFKEVLSQPIYQNATAFLQLLQHFFLQPDIASRKAFLQQVESSLAFGPSEQEDLPSMSYYAWLKSKMQNRNYYDVLVELAAG
ncbi:hypothetical protein TH61_15990 [Rufibacter sp. DG15C]|uniref:hypothetical protein n=1 Tax=Rufibacter sp. DG15C TaxID=1379909 RepID=UPI00078CA9F2|nr:hypothetical protein [Rufibacter sp. DG15C]AMM52388.1 hypothetical protein TH61_15990 [Rufibacter sp. DG15C]